MKFKLPLIIFSLFLLFFLSSCGTNNFCKIDAATLRIEATAYVDAAAEADFSRSDLEVVPVTFKADWLSSHPDGTAAMFVADFKLNDAYNKAIDNKYKSLRTSCITLEDIEGPSSQSTMIRAKDWIDAIKQGPIEFFVVFPLANGLIGVSSGLGGNIAANIFAILIITFLLRSLVLGLTFKQSLQAQKMQEIQPEIAKIQAKYRDHPDARQRISQETMALYAKHNIKIASAFLAPFLTLPIFFAMWAAVNETYVLKQGVLFGVSMGKNVSSYLFQSGAFDFASFACAAFLFALSVLGQVILIRLPMWRQKRNNAKRRIVLDQKALEAQKQSRMMSNIMLIFMIFISFSLPSGMLIYLVGSNLYSIGQSFALDYYTKQKKARKN